MNTDLGMSVHTLIGEFKCHLVYTTLAFGEFSDISDAPLVCQLGGEDWTLQRWYWENFL
jgi:hypothetical protein